MSTGICAFSGENAIRIKCFLLLGALPLLPLLFSLWVGKGHGECTEESLVFQPEDSVLGGSVDWDRPSGGAGPPEKGFWQLEKNQ